MSLHVVGVRHHSPACARLVRSVIRAVKPAFVLIEGPADMNDRLDELRMPHKLPIAIFTFFNDHERTHASWTPFCDYSPEWIALNEGFEAGAEVRFFDLPAWAPAFAGIRNRYADGHRAQLGYVQKLIEELGVDGMDALWDHLFEQPLEATELAERLDVYFDSIREDDLNAESRDALREAFMIRNARHALGIAEKTGKDVVVVCGGFHKPAIERACAERFAKEVDWPTPPELGVEARSGSYLVPYSFTRLDSFTGYESGMPSPSYYQTLWEMGADRTYEKVLLDLVKALRDKKQTLSSADFIATNTMARGLARLRGHEVPNRVDLLDGVAAALVKEAQDVPLPWTRRGPLREGTHPIVVEVVSTLSGRREGRLAPGTPHPPLIADVENQLGQHELKPQGQRTRDIHLELVEKKDVERSRVLHRLALLQIPGFVRVSGPSWATDPMLEEVWTARWDHRTDAALIEASAFGATLEDAARASLEESLLDAGFDIERLASLLGAAVFIGLGGLSKEILDRISHQARAEPQLSKLGPALAKLLGLWRHDSLLGSRGTEALGRVIEAAFDRGMWLFEEIEGPTADADEQHIEAAMAFRDTIRFAGEKLDVSRRRATELMERRSVDSEAPPAIRGAALGFLWSLAEFPDTHEAVRHALMAIRAAAAPKTLGDYLAGLFALAREEVLDIELGGGREPTEVQGGPLIAAIDAAVGTMDEEAFLIAVPALRNAFSHFPPREKDNIARSILVRHGGDPYEVREFRRLDTDSDSLVQAAEFEKRVAEQLERFGLLERPEEESEVASS